MDILQYTLRHIEAGDAAMSEYLDFVVEHGDGHISFCSLKHWDYFGMSTQQEWWRIRNVGIAVVCRDGPELVGVSLVSFEQGDSCGDNSVTAVHRDYRRNSIGSELLRRKCQAAADSGVYLSATVALTNEASVRMCSSVMGGPTRTEKRLKYVEFSNHRFFKR